MKLLALMHNKRKAKFIGNKKILVPNLPVCTILYP